MTTINIEPRAQFEELASHVNFADNTNRPQGVARIYSARLIRAGTPNGWALPAGVLRSSLSLWSGAGVYVDHPSSWDTPSVRDLIGAVRNPVFNADHIAAEIHLFDIPQATDTIELLDTIINQRDAGLATPPTGLSAVLSLTWEHDDATDARTVTGISKVWSVDVVYEPAADGHVLKVLNSRHPRAGGDPANLPTMSEPTNTNPEPGANTSPSASTPSAAAAAQATSPDALQRALLRAQCIQLLDLQLANTGFVQEVQNAIRAKFTDADGVVRIFAPDELQKEIEAARTLAAVLSQSMTVQGMGQPADARVTPGSLGARGSAGPRIHGVYSDLDQFAAAYDRMMGLDITEPALRDVPRLTGIREAYHLLSGDRELTGIFKPDRVMFANATSSTIAELTRNVMNKVVTQTWSNMADYRWWQKVVSIKRFESLKDASWITIGGFGDLSTVTEGASYPEVSWDDNRETSTWLKKGGYLGLTMEMIDKDDTERWAMVPRAMAIAALRTLSASVGAVFTANTYTGPTLSDSIALFNASHNNLASTALSAANWDAAVQGVFKQTELVSGRRLALRPSLLIVPIELRKTAVGLFVSSQEPGGNNNDVNVAGWSVNFDSDNVVVSPEFTSTTGWFAMVDPRIAYAIGVGFRFGDQPEVFVSSDPYSYLMFHNDVLPIKVRYFYTVGVADFRPVYRGNA